MTSADDSEAFLNSFEHIMTAAGWPKGQWVAVLIPCLVGTAQQAIDTLPTGDVADYWKAQDVSRQTLNLSAEAYRWR